MIVDEERREVAVVIFQLVTHKAGSRKSEVKSEVGSITKTSAELMDSGMGLGRFLVEDSEADDTCLVRVEGTASCFSKFLRSGCENEANDTASFALPGSIRE